jgi:myo-inositol 2-dehydrogenase/D-chiro-inositol 1-dehydrogenase
MTVNVGVIGVGMIGQDHIRRLTHVLSGARVTAVNDTDFERRRSLTAWPTRGHTRAARS